MILFHSWDHAADVLPLVLERSDPRTRVLDTMLDISSSESSASREASSNESDVSPLAL